MEKTGIVKNWYWQITLTKNNVIVISQENCNSIHLYLLISLMCASYKSFNVTESFYLHRAGFFSIYFFRILWNLMTLKAFWVMSLRKVMFDLHLRKGCMHSARGRWWRQPRLWQPLAGMCTWGAQGHKCRCWERTCMSGTSTCHPPTETISKAAVRREASWKPSQSAHWFYWQPHADVLSLAVILMIKESDTEKKVSFPGHPLCDMHTIPRHHCRLSVFVSWDWVSN